jgi:hypothetical protein
METLIGVCPWMKWEREKIRRMRSRRRKKEGERSGAHLKRPLLPDHQRERPSPPSTQHGQHNATSLTHRTGDAYRLLPLLSLFLLPLLKKRADKRSSKRTSRGRKAPLDHVCPLTPARACARDWWAPKQRERTRRAQTPTPSRVDADAVARPLTRSPSSQVDGDGGERCRATTATTATRS